MQSSNKIQISKLEIIFIDDDGFAIGHILNKNRSDQEIEIPFNASNIDLVVGDHLLVELEFVGNKQYKFKKIIKKIECEKNHFFAVVELTPKGKFYLNELERSYDKKIKIQPILIDGLKINKGDVVKAQNASREVFKKLKIKKLKINKNKKSRKTYNQNYAEILEVIGNVLDPNVYSYLVIKEYNLRNNFNQEINYQISNLNDFKDNNRVDLRDLSLVTIDGEDAKDFDDAVYAEYLYKKKEWRVLVAIADVSYYVTSNSALDTEAKIRGNSVYLPNFVIPMLPEELSNDKCSLRPNEDRLCLTVEIILDARGKKKSHSFFRSIINSKKRLTYQQVEGVINKKTTGEIFDDKIVKVINSLNKVYLKLQILRNKRGALNLELAERKILFNDEGWPSQIKKVYGLTSNKIIEELMILANVSAAEEIIKFNYPGIYRVHEPPTPEKYKNLIDVIGKPLANILIGKIPHPLLMNKILEKTRESADYEMINQSILKSQSQAKYHNENKSHFGLALKKYVHFTSPIRRYSDLIIHRQIIEIINNKNKRKNNLKTFKNSNEKFKIISEHISNTERKSVAAERKTIDRLISLLFKEKINELVDCTIISIHKFGIFVSIEDGIADSLLPLRNLPYDWYDFNPIKQTLNGVNTGYKFIIGMKFKAKVIEVEPLTGSIIVKFYNDNILEAKTKKRKFKNKIKNKY